MEAKELSSSSLTVKQRNCAQKNSLLRHTNEKINASIQNEHNQFAKSMDFEAKKLRQKLTIMMPWTKPNATNDARSRSSTKEENSEDNLKLPAIKTEAKSAPCSPNLNQRKSVYSWDNLSISPPEQEVLRRGSFNDITFESPRNSPGLRRKTSRSFSYRGERRPTLAPPLSPTSENATPKLSPLLPRNLKLREQARRESILKVTTSENDEAQSPTLEEEFKSLGTCRYLRRGTDGNVKDLAKEAPETAQK